MADRSADVDRHTLWTVGHSNLALDVFIALLTPHKIQVLADVRRFPGSRRWPHFNADALAEGLDEHCIEYRHFQKLGGRRSKRAPNSPNGAWRVEAFNAYADYLQTPEFHASFVELIDLAEEKRTAIMCSEALPWRCHRRIIADQFIADGWKVLDIIGKKTQEHALPEFARVNAGVLTYPADSLFDGS